MPLLGQCPDAVAFAKVQLWNVGLTVDAATNPSEGLSHHTRLVEYCRDTPVSGDDDVLVVRDDAEERNRQDLEDVFLVHHVALAHHLASVAIDDEVRLRQLGGLDHSDDAVRVADGAHLWCGDDDCAVCTSDGVLEALLDACWAVHQDVVKLVLELGHKVTHLLRCDGVLVSGLCRGEQVQPLYALVADECLLEAALSFNDVDQVVDDSVFEAKDDVEVAEADIGIHDRYSRPLHGQCHTQVG